MIDFVIEFRRKEGVLFICVVLSGVVSLYIRVYGLVL